MIPRVARPPPKGGRGPEDRSGRGCRLVQPRSSGPLQFLKLVATNVSDFSSHSLSLSKMTVVPTPRTATRSDSTSNRRMDRRASPPLPTGAGRRKSMTIIFLVSPHPEPHRWYAQADIQDGVIVKVVG
jgi:hypothetical protein